MGYSVFCGLVSVYTATGEGNSMQQTSQFTLNVCISFNIANMLAMCEVKSKGHIYILQADQL